LVKTPKKTLNFAASTQKYPYLGHRKCKTGKNHIKYFE